MFQKHSLLHGGLCCTYVLPCVHHKLTVSKTLGVQVFRIHSLLHGVLELSNQ